jgi:hypothetical protein
MGYIGLLLNAPYKIDSIVWMRMMLMMLLLSTFFGSLCTLTDYRNQGYFADREP